MISEETVFAVCEGAVGVCTTGLRGLGYGSLASLCLAAQCRFAPNDPPIGATGQTLTTEMKRRRPRRACADPNAFDRVPFVVVNFALPLIISDVPAISMAMIGAAQCGHP
jgi:hypothetical protein